MIDYRTNTDGIEPGQLKGFFQGWPNPPAPEVHLRLLSSSDEIVIAFDTETGKVVGHVNAITDRILTAYIPLLEVLPEYRGQGIANKLMELLLERIGKLYMIDLVCDPELIPFYEKFGFVSANAMIVRNRSNSSGP